MGFWFFLNLFKRTKLPVTTGDEMASKACNFIAAFTGSNSSYDASQLDYSQPSLRLVDQILHEFFLKKSPLPDDLHFLVSAYIFETARRQFGGDYMRFNHDNPFALVIGDPDFHVIILVMEKVKKRTMNGPEDNIPFFYEGIAPLVEEKVNAILI